MTTLREAAQQALEFIEATNKSSSFRLVPDSNLNKTLATLRAALAQEQEQAEPDISRCPQCGGIADNGHDRSIPPNPYFCTKCMAEPVQRKPLTEKEIGRICDAHWSLRQLARAVERAHGIKE